ncbi:MAG: 2-oxoglutarate dehydrogenase, E2 component, dihydrolipoamide succinyltransferase [Ignavibacterium sp.]
MDIIMPKMGESVNEGTIIKWHKKVGDKVKRDEIIFEISTDKVDTEIPAPEDGILTEILVNEGETVEVGTVVARLKPESGEVQSNIEIKSQETQQVEKAEEPVEKIVEAKTDSSNATSAGNIIEIAMPKMGESVMEGTIIKWHKKVGDKVKKDETIFEISTDKVDTEIPSPEEGTLIEILVGEQETVEVGTIVAKLAVGSDVVIAKPAIESAHKSEIEVEEPVSMHENFSAMRETREELSVESDRFYSPLVLSIAEKENVSFEELRKISGSGIDGRVTKKDILAYIEQRKSKKEKVQEIIEKTSPQQVTKSAAPAPAFVPESTSSYSSTDVIKIPMDNIRMKIMEHMVHSRDTSVHVTSMIEADITLIHNFINQKKDEYLQKENVKLTYMAFIADAVVKSLKKYPLLNSTIDGNTILQKKFINLGIAVAIEPTGLIVPNIKGAGERNIIGLAKAIADLANKARTKKLTPDDISNGTFTITNYGVFGTIFGTPIINQPEVAILGVGTVQKKPVVVEVNGLDSIAVRHIVALTLSHDHRLIDGMLGGLFLKSLKDILEGFDPENFN